MTTARAIVGVVTDAEGEPVPGAVISLTAGPVPLPDIAMLTGEDGSFSITAPMPGTYELACNFDDGRSLRARVEVAPDAAEQVRVDLSR